ncbi:hypothetical protein RUM44_003846 [Polyplax serrata]|uniref:rhomboid protease n=1 Tax=Polyplax serrata TaxID=468196 RepID=A0ABR1B165_POLSC
MSDNGAALLSTCGLSVVVAAIWQYENVRNRAFQMLKKNWIKDKIYIFERKKYTWRQEINKKWNQLSQGQKLFVPICFLNVLVFLSWQIKRFQPGMMKYFCSSPFGEATCLPMLLATFSHCNILHLAANMYVLHTFTTGAVQDLGKEQFVALYLSSAVVSSFASYLYKVVRSQTGPSLGASGAVMGMIAYICSKYPDSTLSIIGLPSISFSADTGIKCIILLDIIGLLKGWKFMDHAAHLGGSFCGIAWCQWGNAYIWKKKEPLLEWWHELRTPK